MNNTENTNYPTPKQEYKVLVRCFTFNQSKYIEETLNGFAMQQTNFPFVCLVVDDASTDGTSDALKKFDSVTVLSGNGSLFYSGGMRLAISEAKKYIDDHDRPITIGRGARKNMTITTSNAPIPAAKYPFFFPSVPIPQ